jgi:hypothetical protein
VEIGDGFTEQLLDKLKVPRGARRVPGPVARAQPIFSSLLSTEAIDHACGMGMGVLSAFDAEQWDGVGGLWELSECEDRKREIANRRQQIRDVKEQYGDRSPDLALELARLEVLWSQRPEERLRTWTKDRWF